MVLVFSEDIYDQDLPACKSIAHIIMLQINPNPEVMYDLKSTSRAISVLNI